MGFLRKKPKLKHQYDESFLALMYRQKELWENMKMMEEIVVEEHPKLRAERKLARARYFYLFKEARARKITGN